MKLQINPEYEALLPKLPKEEYEALKHSIETEGQHYLITVNMDGIILDGHHRYKACLELGVEPKYEVKKFKNELLERKFVIESNLLRRQLTTFQRIEMAKPLIAIEKELAQRRILRGDPRENFSEGKTLEIVAEKIGTNYTTLRQALWLVENAPEVELDKLRSDERAISNLYKEMKHAEQIEELKQQAKNVQTPEGKYDVIVVDPPWPVGHEYDPENWRGASPYPEMSIEEIKALKLPINDNCILWLWTTNRFMHDAFHVLEAWDFEPKTILTWVKHAFSLGVWLRGQTEHCILATKGNTSVNLHDQATILFAKRREHSRKPDEFYKLIDSLCFGKKLDYFSREEREGWDIFGTIELSKNANKSGS